MTPAERRALLIARYRSGRETWLKTRDAAAVAGISFATAYRWARRGQVTSRHAPGGMELEMGSVFAKQIRPADPTPIRRMP